MRERIDPRQTRYLDDIFEIVGAIVRPEATAQPEDGPDRLGLGASVAFRPYREARLIGDLPTDLGSASARSLINPILEIVRQEGPVHIEEIARRLHRHAGGVRASRRIVEVVGQACDLARRRDALRNDGDFWRLANGGAPRPRNRADASLTLRQIEMIAPSEIREAARLVLRGAPGLDPADAVSRVARGLGYTRVTENISRVIAAEVLRVISRVGE